MFMLRYIYSLTFIISIIYGKAFAANVPSEQFALYDFFGGPTNGLQPHLLIEKSGKNWDDWDIEIDFIAKTNFAKNTWLKITNRVGSKLQLWLTNGVELQLTNPSALAAMNLPSQTAVSNIMRNVHPSNTRGLQWWPVVQHGVVDGESYQATGFKLQSAFDISFTNDVVLQITPLIYKVETNMETAHLVEFPSVKMKLLSNGEVRLNSTRQP
jgi:hypothetical protein